MVCMLSSRKTRGRCLLVPAVLAGALLSLAQWGLAQTPATDLVVELDTSETANLQEWGEKAKQLVEEWYPRMDNLLPTAGFQAPRKVRLVFRKSDDGIAGTAGDTIYIMSGWIEKNPGDIGLVAHELVHVIQSYPRRTGPGWVTEGIADYLRWAVFEGKPLAWFPVPRSRGNRPVERGYEQSYQITAGFFLWLESDLVPGIVNRLNTAMRRRTYSAELFQEATGQTLDDLWGRYMEFRAEMTVQATAQKALDAEKAQSADAEE